MQPEAPQHKPAPKKRRRWLRTIGNLLFVAFIVIQFFQPDKNNNEMITQNHVMNVVKVPDTVQRILTIACYDCHSNNTNYPWYTNIQPLGWWMKDHIDQGKLHVNFSEFALLKPRAGGRFATKAQLQDFKLQQVAETVNDAYMPLKSYTWIHGDAKLTDGQKQILIAWTDSARKQLSLAKEN